MRGPWSARGRHAALQLTSAREAGAGEGELRGGHGPARRLPRHRHRARRRRGGRPCAQVAGARLAAAVAQHLLGAPYTDYSGHREQSEIGEGEVEREQNVSKHYCPYLGVCRCGVHWLQTAAPGRTPGQHFLAPPTQVTK